MKPTPESDRILLIHILERIERIRTFMIDGRAAFCGSRLVQGAVNQNLQSLAQSTRRLSIELRSSEPDVPWEEIAQLREELVHNYLELDHESIWQFVENDLPTLESAIGRMVQANASARASSSGPVKGSDSGVCAK